ncbi:MAG: DsbA family protein [Flavisolibacter sp.]
MAKLTPPVDQADHTIGPAHAPVTLVEFGDYQCPHCKAAHPVVKSLIEALGKNVRFVFRHFPLASVHGLAFPAAIAAEAANKQKKFWQMHDMIYDNQHLLISERVLWDFGAAIELNMTLFKLELMNNELAEKVESNFESGVRSGVNGTPSFFINGIRYNGLYDFESLFTAIKGFNHMPFSV